MADFESLDLDNPHPCIHDLFAHYNEIYFEGKLGACSVKWSSKRMTLCAGVCHYSKLGGCDIRLSEPLLKYRPVSDLKNTLLHEMIHAYLFLTKGNNDHDDHGPSFQDMMGMVNSCYLADAERPEDGYAVTIYHKFTDEVDVYRVHQWRCANCTDLIKRAMNRKPSVSDCINRSDTCSHPGCHWHMHQSRCGGSYEKIHEPAGYIDKRKKVAMSLKIHPMDVAADGSYPNNEHVDKGGTNLTVSGQKRKKSITNGATSKKAIKGPPLHSKIASLEDFFCIVKKDEGTIPYMRDTATGEEDGSCEQIIKGRSMSSAKHFSTVEMNGKRKLYLSDDAAQKESSSDKTEDCKGVLEGQSSPLGRDEEGSPLQTAGVSEMEESSSDKTADIDVRTGLTCMRVPSPPSQRNKTIVSTSYRQHRPGKDASGTCVSSSRRKRLKTEVCKDPLVILAWANWVSYESDEEYEEPLVNKRTERRKQERRSELFNKGKLKANLQNESDCPMETCFEYPLEHKWQDDSVNRVAIVDASKEEISENLFVGKNKDILIELSDDEYLVEGTVEKNNCPKELTADNHYFVPEQALLDLRDLETEDLHQDGLIREASKKDAGNGLLSLGETQERTRGSSPPTDLMICPICNLIFRENERNIVVNKHIDDCLDQCQ